MSCRREQREKRTELAMLTLPRAPEEVAAEVLRVPWAISLRVAVEPRSRGRAETSPLGGHWVCRGRWLVAHGRTMNNYIDVGLVDYNMLQ